MIRQLAVTLALALAATGCFDSLVGGECAPGWVAHGDRCEPREADQPDGGVGVDEPVCTGTSVWCGACVELDDDPANCGACGRSCASGICAAGACVGELPGHVVVIGHDYRVHHAASARLLGNAAALSGDLAVRVASIRDGAPDEVVAAVQRALSTGLAANGRSWEPADLNALSSGSDTAVDVVLVHPRQAPASDSFRAGELARPALEGFVTGGGVVIALDGPDGTTADFLRGAGLVDVSAASTVTGTRVDITAPADALAAGVPSPYMAALGSITFTTSDPAAIVATAGGGAIALHVTW